MVTDKTISGNSGKVVLGELFKNGGSPAEIVKAKNLAQVSDESFIQETITKILSEIPRKCNNILQARKPCCNGSWDRLPGQPKAKPTRQ